jgi:hypothetical protein
MKKLLLSLLLLTSQPGFAQFEFPYLLEIKAVNQASLPGLHSFAIAQVQEEWLIIGGRRDGLHARQPFNAFPASANNDSIYLYNPNNQQLWSSGLGNLPTALQEQLQATNLNFYQEADTLYLVGGYGYSLTAANHITHPYLTTVQLSGLAAAIKTGQIIAPFFKQLQHNDLAVTGGNLAKIEEVFYLVGGHRFDGRYNPMNNPTFTQQYTDQVRRFTVNNQGSSLSVQWLTPFADPVHLHRRDYNLLPLLRPQNQEAWLISSGVFQLVNNLPYLYPVEIDSAGIYPKTQFSQLLSNYHSAKISLYDSTLDMHHYLFLGGMARYYYQGNTLIEDNQVPFVNTISRLSRNAQGQFQEFRMTGEMPAFLGASAEFIPVYPHQPHHHLLQLPAQSNDTLLLGYLVGGIYSPQRNPFSNNQTQLTNAHNSLYQVRLLPGQGTGTAVRHQNPYFVRVGPNPFKKTVTITFELEKIVAINYLLHDSSGRLLDRGHFTDLSTGINEVELTPIVEANNKVLTLTLIFDQQYYHSIKLLQK